MDDQTGLNEEQLFNDQIARMEATEPPPPSDPLQDITRLIWIDETSPELDVDIFLYVKPGSPPRVMAIFPDSTIELIRAGLEEHKLHSVWTMPDRERMENYRRRSVTYSNASGIPVVDEMQLADQVVVHHLKLLSVDDHPVHLHRSKDTGAILPGSLKSLKGMHSGLYDTLYTKYRSEACLLT
jgi:hypothetical protein